MRIRDIKRAVLAVPIAAAVLPVAYGYTVTRRERQYHQLVIEGDTAMMRADTAAAVSAFGDAIRLKPDSMLGYLKRGDARRRRGELTAAADDLEKARSLNPTEPRVRELLGDVALAGRLHERAASHYRAYLELDDQPRVLYKLALAKYFDGKPRDAIQALRHAIRMDSRFGEAQYLLGICLRSVDQLAGAQAAFERAVAVAPTLLAAREQLVEIFGIQGRRPERIRQLEELLIADPRAVRQVTLAAAYADAGQVPRAIRMLGVAADLYPSHPGTFVALGKVWLDQSGGGADRAAMAKATEALQQAVSMEASSAALTQLGRARLMGSDPWSAERTLRQATETLPADPAAFLYLADAADRTGRPQAARRALLEYEALAGGTDPEFLVRLAHACWRSGDAAAARRALARLFERDPDNESGRELERRIR